MGRMENLGPDGRRQMAESVTAAAEKRLSSPNHIQARPAEKNSLSDGGHPHFRFVRGKAAQAPHPRFCEAKDGRARLSPIENPVAAALPTTRMDAEHERRSRPFAGLHARFASAPLVLPEKEAFFLHSQEEKQPLLPLARCAEPYSCRERKRVKRAKNKHRRSPIGFERRSWVDPREMKKDICGERRLAATARVFWTLLYDLEEESVSVEDSEPLSGSTCPEQTACRQPARRALSLCRARKNSSVPHWRRENAMAKDLLCGRFTPALEALAVSCESVIMKARRWPDSSPSQSSEMVTSEGRMHGARRDKCVACRGREALRSVVAEADQWKTDARSAMRSLESACEAAKLCAKNGRLERAHGVPVTAFSKRVRAAAAPLCARRFQPVSRVNSARFPGCASPPAGYGSTFRAPQTPEDLGVLEYVVVNASDEFKLALSTMRMLLDEAQADLRMRAGLVAAHSCGATGAARPSWRGKRKPLKQGGRARKQMDWTAAPRVARLPSYSSPVFARNTRESTTLRVESPTPASGTNSTKKTGEQPSSLATGEDGPSVSFRARGSSTCFTLPESAPPNAFSCFYCEEREGESQALLASQVGDSENGSRCETICSRPVFDSLRLLLRNKQEGPEKKRAERTTREADIASCGRGAIILLLLLAGGALAAGILIAGV